MGLQNLHIRERWVTSISPSNSVQYFERNVCPQFIMFIIVNIDWYMYIKFNCKIIAVYIIQSIVLRIHNTFTVDTVPNMAA